MSELFNTHTHTHPKKKRLCLTLMRSVEQTLQLDDVMAGTRGQKRRVTFGGRRVCLRERGKGVHDTR